jgi:UDP-glucuronate decarboxylase
MRADDGRVITNFLVQATTNEPITVYGDGSHTRSFCYVTDMVEGLVKMMGTTSGFLGPVNLGSPHEISMLDLAKEVIEVTKSRSKIVFGKIPNDDPRRRKPNVELAGVALGWNPKISLTEGLRLTHESMFN